MRTRRYAFFPAINRTRYTRRWGLDLFLPSGFGCCTISSALLVPNCALWTLVSPLRLFATSRFVALVVVTSRDHKAKSSQHNSTAELNHNKYIPYSYYYSNSYIYQEINPQRSRKCTIRTIHGRKKKDVLVCHNGGAKQGQTSVGLGRCELRKQRGGLELCTRA